MDRYSPDLEVAILSSVFSRTSFSAGVMLLDDDRDMDRKLAADRSAWVWSRTSRDENIT